MYVIINIRINTILYSKIFPLIMFTPPMSILLIEFH